MIYRHNKSGTEYRKLHDAFDVYKQYWVVVYIGLASGQIFTRPQGDFMDKFTKINDDPILSIVPKPLEKVNVEA